MADFQVSPFTGNVFARRPAGVPLTEAGGLPPVKQRGSIAPFDRIMISGGSPEKVNRPYEQSTWVMRAIKEIAGPISSVSLKFRDPATENEINDAPWMPFWKKPVRNLMLSDFVEAIIGWLKLSGEAFIILQPEFTVPFPDVQAVWPPLILARPDCMRAEKSSDGELLGWEYSANGKRVRLSPDQVIQPKFWNPYDAVRGMSEYEAARVATESDYLSGKFALNLSRANGDTGVIVTAKGGAAPTDDQQKQITDMLRLKQQKSLRGEFASVFLTADLEVQDPKVRTMDANHVAQRIENRHEIYIAFGVPPSMADIVASYSIGSASDWYRLITGTCMKDGQKVEDAISQIASRQNGSPVEAYFSYDEHPVMQAVRRERIASATQLWDRGLPWEAISDYLDLDLPPFKGNDVGYISFGLAPVGEATDPKNQPETNPDLAEQEEPIKEMLRALRLRRKVAKQVICGCCSLDGDLTLRANDTRDVKLWKSIVAKRREIIRAYQSKFTNVLMVARREVLQKIERHPEFTKSVTRAAAADFIFDLANFTKIFQVQMRNAGLNALQQSGQQLFDELKRDDAWRMPQAEAIQFLKNRENKLSNVPKEVHERINGALQDGFTAGDSLKEIAASVRSEFNDLGEKRARVIASTETAAAAGTGRHLAMLQAGVQSKQWLTSGNANVRSAHEGMNGAKVPIDQPFLVIDPKNGQTDSIQHPGDTTGAPWNVINCHCVELAVAEEEEES